MAFEFPHIALRSLGRSGHRGRVLVINAKSHRSLLSQTVLELSSFDSFSFCSVVLLLSFSEPLLPHLLNERLEQMLRLLSPQILAFLCLLAAS